MAGPDFCERCNAAFERRAGHQRFCSYKCKRRAQGARRDATRRRKTRGPTGRQFRQHAEFGGLVYFIQAVSGGPIKIGCAVEPEKRLAQLQVAHWQKLVLRGVLPGGSRLEHELHLRFAKHRLQGEWFEPTAELQALAGVPPQQLLAA